MERKRITSTELEKVIKKITSYTNFSKEASSRIQSAGFENHLAFDGNQYTFKNLDVTVDQSINLFETHDSSRKISFLFSHCNFLGDINTLLYLHFISGAKPSPILGQFSHAENPLTMEHCNFDNVAVEISTNQSVKFINGTGALKSLRVFLSEAVPKSKLPLIQLQGMGNFEVVSLSIDPSTKDLRIHNVQIGTSNLSELLTTADDGRVIQNISFDLASNITDTNAAYGTYKALRALAKKLDDKVQAHIFYVKELEQYGEQKGVRWDDKTLIIVNKFLNGNGTNFIRPICLAVLVNIIALLWIIWLEWGCRCFVDIHTYLDLRHLFFPVNSILLPNYEYSVGTYAIDGARRLLYSVMIFMTISAALRFRFKGF